MQYCVPLNTTDWIDQKENKRQFIFFDERLTIHLRFSNDNKEQDKIDRISLGNFTVWINEAMLIQGPTLDYFKELSKNHWILKDDVCSKYLFKSNVVMNNGYDNVIKFQVDYQIIKNGFSNDDDNNAAGTNTESFIQRQSGSDDSTLDDDPNNIILPSFEPLYIWNQIKTTNNIKQKINTQNDIHQIEQSSNQHVKSHSLQFQYPIYSLLNMRLRNSHLKSQYCILTSLDFQTSRSLIQLCDKYSIPLDETHFNFDSIKLELINKTSINKQDSHIEIESIKGQSPYKQTVDRLPLIVYPYDSFSMVYKLPPHLIPDTCYQMTQDFGEDENIDIKPHRVRITLQYLVHLNEELKFNILTKWETDITIKRKLDNRDAFKGSNTGQLLKTPHQANANNIFLNNNNNNSNATLSRMSTISLSSIAKFNNSTILNTNQNRPSGYKLGQFSQSHVQQQQTLITPNNSNIKFKFINDTVTVESGNKFILKLQITNMSSQPLDPVIYYNNQSPTSITQSINMTSNGLQTLERKAIWIQRQRQMTEGLILLSNDYKVPIINPHESYFVDLSFVAIRTGYYSTLNALKLIDLRTQACIEIGRAVSVFVK